MKIRSKIVSVLLSLLLSCNFIQPVQAYGEVAMYRLYNPYSGEHLYTADISERDFLAQLGWIYEHIGWYAPSSSSIPVYRLYNPYSGDHHYTMDVSEYDWLETIGWVKEGIGWYSSESNTYPLYRQFNPNEQVGTHNYTIDSYEDELLGTYGWVREGIAWYAVRPSTEAENNESQRSLPYSYNTPYYVDGVLIVNKKHSLKNTYAPGEDPTAGNACRTLINDMRSKGYFINTSYSGYRSYDTQAVLYNNYVAMDGKANADRYSARPGFSEHQTGLAFDLLDGNGNLVESTNEVNWIANNAHNYGFIVRYKEGKEGITGYMAEPWHIRYVGVALATDIYNSGLTLEEYLGVSYGDY